MSEVKACPKCQCNSLEQRRDKSWWCLYASCGYDEPYIDELQTLRDERDRLITEYVRLFRLCVPAWVNEGMRHAPTQSKGGDGE